MAQKNTSHPMMPIVIAFVAAAVFLVYLVAVVQQGAGSTDTKASRNDFLSPGDDALSLQEDLRILEREPGVAALSELDALE